MSSRTVNADVMRLVYRLRYLILHNHRHRAEQQIHVLDNQLDSLQVRLRRVTHVTGKRCQRNLYYQRAMVMEGVRCTYFLYYQHIRREMRGLRRTIRSRPFAIPSDVIDDVIDIDDVMESDWDSDVSVVEDSDEEDEQN